jgi:hexosaminidase
MLVASGNPYILNYSLPLNQWTHASLIGRGNRTYLGLGNGTELEFLSILSVYGLDYIRDGVAVEAPLTKVGGHGLRGLIKDIKLVDYA